MSHEPFFHLAAAKSSLYRAILEAFAASRRRFLAYLRPTDVVDALRAQGHVVEALDEELDQLVRWGNLAAHPDTSEVATVEDFYRRRFLYQLTREGEAVEEALAAYVSALGRHGELQAAALEDVGRYIHELVVLAAAEPLDGAKIFGVLGSLQHRFDGLVEHARSFLSGVQRAAELYGSEAQGLLAYKERLVQYLERFIGELARVGSEVADLLELLDPAARDRLSAAAARREVIDRLDAGPVAEAEAAAAWRSRIDGIATWFVSTTAHPSQADELRHRARVAIPALLGAILAHHERRLSRSDRVADLRTLAKWFDGAADDSDAHRIWRSCFTLGSTRHLTVDDATLSAWEGSKSGVHTPWGAAPPLEVSPRLRATGRFHRQGPPPIIVDRSEARAHLAARRQAEASLLAEAEVQLLVGRSVRLSDLPVLGDHALDLLTELVGEALGARTAVTTSLDGRFTITLDAPTSGERAVVETVRGCLAGGDYLLRIDRTEGAR